MSTLDLLVKCKLSDSFRCKQLESIFDVPHKTEQTREWHIDLPLEEKPWSIGLILGPSGSGKTLCAKQLFGSQFHPLLKWNSAAVVDDFSEQYSIEDITSACQSVGFNTIPAWLRPYHTLSNGEKFRVDVARRLLELPSPVIVDEFTSVVDRQVAMMASHAVQRFIRKTDKQFVALSCHSDVVDWLQPDWIFQPGTLKFTRRLLQRRPPINVTIGRVGPNLWKYFAPFHYMSKDIHKAATCFGLWVNNSLAAFAALLHRPHPKVKNIKAIHRMVTLPDYQGIGLAFVMMNTLGAALKSRGIRTRAYPAHPPFAKSFAQNKRWEQSKELGTFDQNPGMTCLCAKNGRSFFGNRACAVFEYIGESMNAADATRLLGC